MRKLFVYVFVILLAILLAVFYPKSISNQRCFGETIYVTEKDNPFSYLPDEIAAKIEVSSLYFMCAGIPYGQLFPFPTQIEGPGGLIKEPTNNTPQETTSIYEEPQEYVDMKSKIYESLERANYCETKQDCSVVSYGCPFGCSNLVNKDFDLTEVENQINEYFSQPGPVCMYDCDRIPNPNEIACVNNKCVDLRYPDQ